MYTYYYVCMQKMCSFWYKTVLTVHYIVLQRFPHYHHPIPQQPDRLPWTISLSAIRHRTWRRSDMLILPIDHVMSIRFHLKLYIGEKKNFKKNIIMGFHVAEKWLWSQFIYQTQGIWYIHIMCSVGVHWCVWRANFL